MCPNMNHFDAVDFSDMSLWRSARVSFDAQFTCTCVLFQFMVQIVLGNFTHSIFLICISYFMNALVIFLYSLTLLHYFEYASFAWKMDDMLPCWLVFYICISNMSIWSFPGVVYFSNKPQTQINISKCSCFCNNNKKTKWKRKEKLKDIMQNVIIEHPTEMQYFIIYIISENGVYNCIACTSSGIHVFLSAVFRSLSLSRPMSE